MNDLQVAIYARVSSEQQSEAKTIESQLSELRAHVKALGLATHLGGRFVIASPESIWDRSYPLHRFTTLYINRTPGRSVDPKVAEFVRYILSREGMQAVSEDAAYTPLNEDVAVAQRAKLQ